MNKVKTGLLAVIILRFIYAFFSILFSVLQLVPAFEIIFLLDDKSLILSIGYSILNIILALGVIISCVLILCKKKKGVYIYFVFELFNIALIFVGIVFKWTIVLDILLLVLMYIFINKQKQLFR